MKSTVIVVIAASLLGCSKPDASGAKANAGAAPPLAPAAMTAARELFKTRCVPCHGETGGGDGPGAAALNPKPRNYTDAKWQASVTDEQLKKTILYGGAAVGKSPNMPGNPDLDGKPELDGLVAVVRSFKGK